MDVFRHTINRSDATGIYLVLVITRISYSDAELVQPPIGENMGLKKVGSGQGSSVCLTGVCGSTQAFYGRETV